MSLKSLDSRGHWRSKTITFRVSPEENAAIDKYAKLSGLTKQTYLCRCCKDRKVVVNANPRVFLALKKELLSLCEEIRRMSDGSQGSPEFWEAVQMALTISNDLKKGS